MSLTLGDNFSYQASKPLDARLKYDTLAAMKAVADATMYDGCLAYCTATDKTYQWKSTNTVDETLGKWREFQTGGGGHEILDAEDTALTQREKLKFGNGLAASDNSTDEQTEVEVDVMSSEDMDDVVTPLPSTQKGYHKYSTDEQVVGEWIDQKPLYQRTCNYTFTNGTQITNQLAINLPSGASIKNISTGMFKYVSNSNTYYCLIPATFIGGETSRDNWSLAFSNISLANIAFQCGSAWKVSSYTNIEITFTIQYTKTTD